MTDDQSSAEPERAQVERQFRREVQLPEMELPDWDFVRQAVELLRGYRLEDEPDTFALSARDRRGTYNATDLEPLRTEFDQREEELESLTIRCIGRDQHGFRMFTVYVARTFGPVSGRAEFQGGDETEVNGLAARVEDFANRAAKRLQASREEEAKKPEPITVSVETSQPIPTLDKSPRSLLTHPWVVTVGGGLVVGAVLYLIFGH